MRESNETERGRGREGAERGRGREGAERKAKMPGSHWVFLWVPAVPSLTSLGLGSNYLPVGGLQPFTHSKKIVQKFI